MEISPPGFTARGRKLIKLALRKPSNLGQKGGETAQVAESAASVQIPDGGATKREEDSGNRTYFEVDLLGGSEENDASMTNKQRFEEQDDSIYTLSEAMRGLSPVLSRYAIDPLGIQLLGYSFRVIREILLYFSL